MRFVHCADLHLDSPLRGQERYDGAPVQDMREATRRSFTNIIDLALEREVDFILIAGDVFDGDAVAADAEQRAADAAARLSNLITEYASARLSSTIISEDIETYQQRFQGPLLARASELFANITGGRFAKVATDFDEDMTIFVGVRANGKRETVGSLSSGTRDQLFLVLRLAAIESHVDNQEPMPMVVDDIVINFDDASASATFKVLAELSKKTQVLVFTHHEHLLEQAAGAIDKNSFVVHKLVGVRRSDQCERYREFHISCHPEIHIYCLS